MKKISLALMILLPWAGFAGWPQEIDGDSLVILMKEGCVRIGEQDFFLKENCPAQWVNANHTAHYFSGGLCGNTTYYIHAKTDGVTVIENAERETGPQWEWALYYVPRQGTKPYEFFVANCLEAFITEDIRRKHKGQSTPVNTPELSSADNDE